MILVTHFGTAILTRLWIISNGFAHQARVILVSRDRQNQPQYNHKPYPAERSIDMGGDLDLIDVDSTTSEEGMLVVRLEWPHLGIIKLVSVAAGPWAVLLLDAATSLQRGWVLDWVEKGGVWGNL